MFTMLPNAVVISRHFTNVAMYLTLKHPYLVLVSDSTIHDHDYVLNVVLIYELKLSRKLMRSPSDDTADV